MADRKRRGEDASEDRFDDVDDALVDDDAVDDDLADDELDLDDELDVEEDEEPVRARSSDRDARGTRASLIKTRAESRPKTAARGRSVKDRRPSRTKTGGRPNILARFVNFVREVVAELRKVIWPTRKELLTYTAVVVVFVTVMLAIVGGLDWVFTQVAIWVFGEGTATAE